MRSNRLERFKGNIYICGFMASGKSTLGKFLADRMEWDYRDLDKVIEEGENMSINKIFRDEGEDYFRKKEQEYLIELSGRFKGIISLGGGALQNQHIVDHLKVSGLLIFVDTPLDTIVERVMESDHRPILFDDKGEIKSKETLFTELKALYSEREKFYKQAQIKLDSSLYPKKEQMIKAAIDKITRHV